MQFICALTYLQQVMWQCVSLKRWNKLSGLRQMKIGTQNRREQHTHRGGNQKKDFSQTYKWKGGKIRDEGCLETSPWKVWTDHFQADCANRHISKPIMVTQNPHIYTYFLGWLIFDKLVKLHSLWMSCGAHKFGEFIGHIMVIRKGTITINGFVDNLFVHKWPRSETDTTKEW